MKTASPVSNVVGWPPPGLVEIVARPDRAGRQTNHTLFRTDLGSPGSRSAQMFHDRMFTPPVDRTRRGWAKSLLGTLRVAAARTSMRRRVTPASVTRRPVARRSAATSAGVLLPTQERRRAKAPATWGVDIDVPFIERSAFRPPRHGATTRTPGANQSVIAATLENKAGTSWSSVADTA